MTVCTTLTLVQAKGYPDIASRSFLNRLYMINPSIPIYALVDYDPDGISILSTYKYGSISLAHESIGLSTPTIKWLGIRSTDIRGHNDSVTSLVVDNGIMRLSARDRKKATNLLEGGECKDGGSEQEWRRELQVMMMLGAKAEMQILDRMNGGLEKWLRVKLSHY